MSHVMLARPGQCSGASDGGTMKAELSRVGLAEGRRPGADTVRKAGGHGGRQERPEGASQRHLERKMDKQESGNREREGERPRREPRGLRSHLDHDETGYEAPRRTPEPRKRP